MHTLCGMQKVQLAFLTLAGSKKVGICWEGKSVGFQRWIFKISGRSLFATYILYRLVKWHVPSPDMNLKSNNNNNKKANSWVILERRAFSPRHPKRSSATEQGNKCEYGTSAPWLILQTGAPKVEFLRFHTFYPMAVNAKQRSRPGKRFRFSIKNVTFVRNSIWKDRTAA